MATLPIASPSERISLPALAKEQGVSPVSTWRWALSGACGVILPTFFIGNRRFTTRVAFQEWCNRVTLARNGETVSRAPAQRESAIDRAVRETARQGV